MVSSTDKMGQLAGLALEELFPSQCLGCDREGPWLCPMCQEDCLVIRAATCPFCDRLSPLGRTCLSCRRHHSLNGARAIWYYRGAVRELIQAIKYRGVTAAINWLAPFLEAAAQTLPLPKHQPIIITAVPIDPRRFRERGFNQSELMALEISRRLGFPYRPLLTITDPLPSQTTLTRRERLANVRGKIELAKPRPTLPTNFVIVVDDVLTTGATLAACAVPLKAAGAKAVWALTVARD